MDNKQAKKLIRDVFESSFNKSNFIIFLKNLLKNFEDKTFVYQGNYIPDSFKQCITSLERIGKYTYDNKEIDLLIVRLKQASYIEQARKAQRNFIAYYLKGSRGGKLKDAALVAYVSPDSKDWRFSLVKMDYHFEETLSGKTKINEDITPAKRWSFLVGESEKSHTAQSRFVGILENDNFMPTLEDLEQAFDIEVVTKEFFQEYRDLFIRTKLELDEIVKNNQKVRQEFENKNINSVDFAKKLLGQITFLYFLQKKGWFGVEKGEQWGSGSKDFMRRLFNKEYCDYKNFYNDILEPLFFEALRTDRTIDDHYYSKLNCKLPFLNGGLFDPVNNYDWVDTEVLISDTLFSNNNKTKNGDIGNGILDIFDRYNFTVNEEEPLEKEVALDPELLGKTYEKLNAIRADNFDKYYQVLISGKKGEETKFNREYGVYYTPRQIVHYMCQESLINYLNINLSCDREDLESFVRFSDSVQEIEAIYLEKQNLIKNGELKSTNCESHISKYIKENAKQIDNLLAEIKVCDPAVGSGAFPIGMMHEIVKLRQLLSLFTGEQVKTYDLKRLTIENSLYGVDIDPGAVEICKLRFWLSMIVDEEDFYNIKPLPNLDYKVVCGNSLIGFQDDWKSQYSEKIEKLIKENFSESNPMRKKQLKSEIDKIIKERLENSEKNFGYKIDFDFRLYFPVVFNYKNGFDIVIANPPYVSTKGVDEKDKKIFQKIFGFADDLYSHFYFRGMQILQENGILAFISSKTFWTIQTKKNLRELILKNKLLILFDTANPFDTPMVDTCVILVQKSLNSTDNYTFSYLDGTKSITSPTVQIGNIEYYKNAPNQVFFPINDYNLKIYKQYGKKVNELLNQWWDKISTSKNIEKYKAELEEYRKTLKPGDITLLGLITEGGQGLATGNNGRYIGVLEGTKWAENVRKQRPEKLLSASIFCKEKGIRNKNDASNFLNDLSEQRIRELFDELKEKYGRDIFGQGWLYRIVNHEEIAKVEDLTDDEKFNGILGKKTFVPYDKGDKDGNRWYAPTPYYIDWSRENVKFLKENSGKKGEGMPVVRNLQFYFREGFCWTDVNSTYLKARIKENGVYDVLTMSLFSSTFLPDLLFVCIINSKFISEYVDNFVNSTSHFQINDARQLPIIIPTSKQLNFFESLFTRAVSIQKDKFSDKISKQQADELLNVIQKELDNFVENMYIG